jgi:serine/threonine protein kinase/Tol biopolymer transport system component
MGTVYRATDTKLNRPVAIKLLSDEFADVAARQRFQREAQLASSLNHPHILTVYDTGEYHGRQYLVTEFVDGGTLKDWIKAEKRTVRQIVELLTGVADALAAAHEAKITHRDIKPANILIAKNGYAKLADFGLAKLLENADPGATRTIAEGHTRPGSVIGTIAYMSPEQASGHSLDGRSDIFSFGVVLYEMLTGRRPFSGKTDLEVMQRVIHAAPEPPGAEIPQALRYVVEKALEKDPADRYQTARDLVVDLRRLGRQRTEEAAAVSAARSKRRWLPWGVAAIFGLAALVGAIYFRGSPASPEKVNYEILPPEGGEFAAFETPDHDVMNISPDGRSIAFVGTVAGRNQIWIRERNSVSPRVLAGTENGFSPFWSPDGRSLAFFADGQLKAIDVAGGPPRAICAVSATAFVGTWGSRGEILFSDFRDPDGGIRHVKAEGGMPELTVRSDSEHQALLWPQFLPNGKQFLYIDYQIPRGYQAMVGSLEGGSPKALMPVRSRLQYASPGYVFFVREGALLAQRFNLGELRLEGAPIQVVGQMEYFAESGFAPFSVSQAGVLVYQPRGNVSRLAWMDRNGRETGTVMPLAAYQYPRLSPDGKKLVVGKINPRSGSGDLYVTDLASGTSVPITTDPRHEFGPVWSPDGRFVAFSQNDNAPPFLHKVGLDGGAVEALVAPSGGVQTATDWLKDGSILYQAVNSVTNTDLMLLPADGDRKPRNLLATISNEMHGTVSPDGHWLAYVTDDSDQPQVYVRSFPSLAGVRRVSLNGGLWPRWARDGRELYFMDRGRLMAIAVRASGELEAGSPIVLFQPSAGLVDYDVAADGRFLVNLGKAGFSATRLNVVMNWDAGLK